MADEFQAEVCGGTWWNSSRLSMFGSSPCSSAGILDLGNFGWPTDFLDIKTTTTRCSPSHHQDSNSTSDGSSIVIQDLQLHKPNNHHHHHHHHQADSSIDSTLQILGIGLSSATTTTTSTTTPTTDWNPALIHGSNGRPDQSNNYQPILLQQQDLNSSMNYRQESGVEDCPPPDNLHDQIQKDCWRSSTTLKNNSFSSIPDAQDSSSSLNSFKSLGNQNQPLNPMNSISYGYSSALLQTLFDSDPQPQQPLYANRALNYPPSINYSTSLNELPLASLPKFSPLQKLQPQNNNSIQFSGGQIFCDATSAAALNDFPASFFPPTKSQFLSSTFNDNANLPNLAAKANNSTDQEVVQGGLSTTSGKKTGSEPAFKRPRIETPSPLPTFKVRKEKLGDRITALQQLVSPFGKTDTASVLHEAIEYIKFLHDQVNVLSTPYMKNGSPIHRQQSSDKARDEEGSKEDLKSRGLCLVPISSTFPVAAEATTDFWTPTFGSSFR